MPAGLLLIGHGSRLQQAQDTFINIIEKVQKVYAGKVIGANLSVVQPDIPTSVNSLVQAGVNKIYIVPLFLYPGVHVTRDIPNILAKEKEKYPQVEFVLGDFIGNNDRLVEIILDSICQ